VELSRIWRVGEEKYGKIKAGGFDEQNSADVYKRIQATSRNIV
jgi:hypothetical protein